MASDDEGDLYGPGTDLAFALSAVLLIALVATVLELRRLQSQIRCEGSSEWHTAFLDCIRDETGREPEQPGDDACSTSVGEDLVKFKSGLAEPASDGFEQNAGVMARCLFEATDGLRRTHPGAFDHIDYIYIDGHTDCQIGRADVNMELGAERASFIYAKLRDVASGKPEPDAVLDKVVVRSFGAILHTDDAHCDPAEENPDDRRITVTVRPHLDTALGALLSGRPGER